MINLNCLFSSTQSLHAMKLTQIAIITNFVISSHVALAATYQLPDNQQPSFTDLPPPSSIESEPGESLFGFQFPNSEAQNYQLNQEYQKAIRLLKKRDFASAEHIINDLIQQSPDDANLYILLASLQFLEKENDKAIISYQKASALDPNNVKAQLGLAVAFLKNHNLPQAKKHVNKAISINEKLAHPYILLAEIAYQENKPQEIEPFLLKAKNNARGDNKLEILAASRLAKLYAIQKTPKKALTIAQETLNHYPYNSSALALMANAQILNNQLDQAIETLEKLIGQEHKDIQHRLVLARLFAKKPGNKQKVINLLDEATKITPDDPRFLVQKGILLLQLQLFTEALQTSNRIKQVAPETGWAEFLQGEIFLAQKKQPQALTAFKKSYKIKPDPKALNIITNILMAEKKQEEAIQFLNQELKAHPDNLAAHYKLGNIYQLQTKNDKATEHYQAILDKQPDNPVILNNLSWVYHQQNNPKALSLAKRAYQLAPQSAAIADTYAVILIKQGDKKKALDILQKAVTLDPKNYDIQYHLADAYIQNGQKLQAIQILQTISSSNKQFSEKDAAIKLLKNSQ